MFRTLMYVAAMILEVLGVSWLISTEFSLVSSASTANVFIGCILLVFTAALGTYALYRTVLAGLRGTTQTQTNKTVAGLAILALVALNTGCVTVTPGHVGIKVDNYGTDRGVQSYTLQTGAVWFMPGWSKVFEYPTNVQTVVWTANPNEGSGATGNNEEFIFNSKDAAVIKADVSLSYQLDAAHVPSFYVKFRSDNLEDFTNGYLHNVARDAFQEISPNYTALDLYGVKKDEFIKAVQDRIASQTSALGLNITQFGLIGNLRLPEELTNAITSKIAATQNAIRAQNEVAQAQAEAQKAIAKADGESKANQLLTRSLTPELIQWRQLDIQQQAIAKWNGTLPQFTTGNGIPLIQIPQGTRSEH